MGSWKNPLAVQFHGHPIDFVGEGFASRTVNCSLVLHIPIAESAPEIRKAFANLGPVTGNPSDHFGA
jgi:hypothetical protein